MQATIVFKCPACKSSFEFDPVGENELVSCPICGNDFRTVKNGQTLQLDYFNFGKDVCFDVKASLFPFGIDPVNQAK